jgi:hypothetical protein
MKKGEVRETPGLLLEPNVTVRADAGAVMSLAAWGSDDAASSAHEKQLELGGDGTLRGG